MNSRYFLGAHSIVHLRPGTINKTLSWIGEGPIVVAHVLITSLQVPATKSGGDISGHLEIVMGLYSQLGNGQDRAAQSEGGEDYLDDHLDQNYTQI